jgi:hypothetical protein
MHLASSLNPHAFTAVRSGSDGSDQPDPGSIPVNPAWFRCFAENTPSFPVFTKIPFHLRSFLTVQSFFFILAQNLFKSLQFSPYTFLKQYLGRFSSDFSVLYVHAFVSKRRLVLCYCLDLFDLSGDCFLFIPIVCLYVMIVDRRERFVWGIWRSSRARVLAARLCWRQVFLLLPLPWCRVYQINLVVAIAKHAQLGIGINQLGYFYYSMFRLWSLLYKTTLIC